MLDSAEHEIFSANKYENGIFVFIRWEIFMLSYGLHYKNTPIQIYRKNYLQRKKENYQIKNWYFHISAQNIDCGYSLEPPCRGGSNEYPHSMFWAVIRKIIDNLYTQFYYIKMGFKGVKII